MKIVITVISVFYFIFLSFSKYPIEVFDCSSTKFNDFPLEIKEECVRLWQEEMYDIMKKLLEIEKRHSYTEV